MDLRPESGAKPQKFYTITNIPTNIVDVCWAFIQCITKILESSKSYTCKIYVGNIGAYPR
jgi:hypothetical protein